MNVDKFNEMGDKWFLDPVGLMPYEELVEKAVAGNTFRGYYKEKGIRERPIDIFRKCCIDGEQYIYKRLVCLETQERLDELCEALCEKVLERMNGYVKADMLNSYNRLRKPIDIFIEHVVAMWDQINCDVRRKVVPYLRLPLDSVMFGSEFVFSDDDIKNLRLNRNWTFGRLGDKGHYYEIQSALKEKAKCMGLRNVIYFDLVWGRRVYREYAKNLLDANPKRG